MLKKDVYAISYVITLLIVAGSVFYYIFFLQKNVIEVFNNDPKLIQVASKQGALGQQLTKAAIGMGYSETERNFTIFQAELARVVPIWKKNHEALISGDKSINLKAPILATDDYNKLQENIKFFQTQMEINATNLLGVSYTTDRSDVSFLSLRASIEALINTVKNYQTAADNISDFLVEDSQSHKTELSLAEKTVFGVFFGLLLIQGFFIFRPLVKLAGDNYLSANKAYVTVKKSEEELKVNYQKQKIINKKLYLSRKQLEENNQKLQDSETKLLRSSEEQIKVNEKLIGAQGELNDAYRKLQVSDVEIRELADKQLEDNEKLFLAEKKIKETLKKEQKSKEELNHAIESLKNAQSHLVHSEKMASLGQLTAGIAHEINNPINFISSGMVSIKMTIESLREIVEEYSRLDDGADLSEVIEIIKELKEDHEYDEMMEELDELVKDVNYGVTRTVDIVKGLRVFSRLDEEEVKSANINENLDATLTLLRNKTKDRITISKFYDDKMKDIECYPGQLNQVFMNILNNAVQAMPEEKKDAEITIYTEEGSDGVVVRIKDNGVGIPEEIRNRIWEPFFTTKAVGEGTGLGMSITYGIIEKHGGKIELISEVGKGTEFAITLPKKVLKIAKKESVKEVEG
ncbi:MAG: signal transduction histidine kinase [Cyclobacteriaceae bacterium]|jgi:signal transduction histidine kinase